MYTAITRAKGNLWIYEETPNQESKLPILRKWTGKEEGLVELIDPSDPHFMPETSFATAKTSTPRQWKLQGDVLRQAGKWRQASFCYQRANRLDLQTETEAEGLEAQQNPNYLQVALAYLKADEISHNIKFIEKIARNLLQAKQFLHAAWLYRRLSKVSSVVSICVATILLEQLKKANCTAINTLNLEGNFIAKRTFIVNGSSNNEICVYARAW